MMLWFVLIWTLATVNCSVAVLLIHVDPSNGTDHPNCWSGNVNCETLNYALGGVTNNDTTIQLSSGLINLTTPNTTLSHLSGFAIIGIGITVTTVKCSDSTVGLFFKGMTNLKMANLTISNCGMLQNSTAWDDSTPVQYPSAVTIYNSSTVVIDSVSFEHNNGIGLSMVNTGGFVTVNSSIFNSNYVPDDTYPGGGGLYIEFPFCLPDDPSLVVSPNFLNSNSHYTISECYFDSNIAKRMTRRRSFNKTSSSCGKQTFGHGGGMSVFFRGHSTNNTIDIINTEFVNNTAVWGGGLFIEFNHYTRNNTVSITGYSQFSHNQCSDDESLDITGGGGIQIAYAPYDSLISPSHNNIVFSDCNFANNTAYWGGAVSYVVTTEKHTLGTGTNSLYFRNCHWQYNVAKFGAAVDMSLYQSLTTGVVQPVLFESCTFVSNNVAYNIRQCEFHLQGVGIVYANSIAVQLKEQIVFNANNGSALVLSNSYVSITEECSIQFIRNRSWRGGAVALLASSWMVVGGNTKVMFIENHADEVGGAVYAEQTNEHNVISQWNCFIQYYDDNVSPDKWNTTIEFQDNYSQRGHSIYATTIRSCVWGKTYRHVNVNDTKDAFHWKTFKFNGKSGTENFTRDSEIATAANSFSVINQSAIVVSSGEEYHLPFVQSDDEGQNAKTVFFIQSLPDDSHDNIGKVDNRSVYVYSDIMQVYGNPNSSVNFSITSAGPIPSTVTLNVKFDHCPPGFLGYKNDNVTFCECANNYPDRIPGIVECNSTSYLAYIARLYWGGVYKEEFVTALCPQGYCAFNKSGGAKYKTSLPSKRSELDFCSAQNRIGIICGECKDGYSISSRQNCIKCDPGIVKGIFFFILYECLPTLVFISAILIFNVNITSGNWNSFIFYFQIVEILNLYALQSTSDFPESLQVLIKIHTNAFGIWNLDFLQSVKPEECYINGMKNVFQYYLLSYFTVLLSSGLIFLIMGIKYCSYRFARCNCCYLRNAVMHNNFCNKCKMKLNTFNMKWKRWFGETSLIHGLAAFIVVSYTRVALLSMKFLIPGILYGPSSKVYDVRTHHVGTITYFSLEHFLYSIPAFIFLIMSIIFPFYLILKPLMRRLSSYYNKEEQCARCDAALYCYCIDMGKVHQFLEEFYGPFRNNCRFYAGFFFLYRLAIYITLAFTTSLQLQYCIQQVILVSILFIHSFFQPYSQRYKLANKIDALIFLNLNCINALSVYNYYSVIDIQGESKPAIAFQLVLIYLPLLYIPFRFIWWFWKTCCNNRGNGEQLPLLEPVHVDLEEERKEMIAQFQNLHGQPAE